MKFQAKRRGLLATKKHQVYAYNAVARGRILTWMADRIIAMIATQMDLSSKNQLNSSTHPWKKAFPVTVSRHSRGSGWRRTM